MRFRDFKNPYPSKLIFVFERYGPFHDNQFCTQGTMSWMMLFSLFDFFFFFFSTEVLSLLKKTMFYCNYFMTKALTVCPPFVGFVFVVVIKLNIKKKKKIRMNYIFFDFPASWKLIFG